MYAASGHELRKDWYGSDDATKGRHRRFVETLRPADADVKGIIAGVFQYGFPASRFAVLYARPRVASRKRLEKPGERVACCIGQSPSAIESPARRNTNCMRARVERGFVQAAKFLHLLHIYRIFDLPYQSQIVPLAAILADIGDAWEHEANREKLVRWYWNGVFGELYGSAVETRIARDFMEVPSWLHGGAEPSTVSETIFRADRLKTMRMRISAAYKGVNALLMKEGAQDFRSGQKFDHTVFFGENVDIHHVFPKDWCKKHGIKPNIFDSIINKSPLSYRTNRIIGGVAPSEYLAKLERGNEATPRIEPAKLDAYIASHLMDPVLLRTDNFDAFMSDRQKQLLSLIEPE